MQNDLSKARLISRALEGSGYFKILSNIHIKKEGAGALEAAAEAATQIVKGQKAFDEEDAEFYQPGLPGTPSA